MQLIGMLDSPYVRRVAISLRLLDLPFEHRAVSVFSTFEQFRAINPVVKAPTLVCDNGVVLMESGLILDYAETLATRSLMPAQPEQRQHALRVIGLALAACEKTVQIVYERNLRPAEKQHEPWIDRVQGQLHAAYAALETELAGAAPPTEERLLTQADVTAAVAWSFTQLMLPACAEASAYPALAAFGAAAERLAVFKDTPQT
ncbi:glutathione S-transferase family protein [Cupriavidus basilensis]|uniref:glutathione S-transferase family protein n=1 Tax=Cupriavidus basilensis TaxID=68895 RepID=UPI00157A54DD|nr:glutathione S-transferase family protein [Cupriavidus basilensis]NUA27397.1 glutathione S-transferase family protein [Cupriavidus basilensis]